MLKFSPVAATFWSIFFQGVHETESVLVQVSSLVNMAVMARMLGFALHDTMGELMDCLQAILTNPTHDVLVLRGMKRVGECYFMCFLFPMLDIFLSLFFFFFFFFFVCVLIYFTLILLILFYIILYYIIILCYFPCVVELTLRRACPAA
jgi:hypothetical protein